MYSIQPDDYMAVSRELEKHHAVFYTLWAMGKPMLTPACETAAVQFDHTGQALNFMFSPELWDASTNYERAFFIAHECLHIVLNHGYRALDALGDHKANVAMDLVVNHSLTRNFGFDRAQIRGADKYCWIDTVFPGQQVSDEQTFEYYYGLLQDMDLDGEGTELVDDHSGMAEAADDLLDVCKDLNEKLTEGEKQGLERVIDEHFYFQDFEQNNESSHSRGLEVGKTWTFAKVEKAAPKKKWETVIKRWALKYMKQEMRETEQWARKNRRFQFVGADLLLPTEVEIEDTEEDEKKIQVWFFQDTSGSCSGFRDRFFKAALTLPPDRFEVRMHCFDTRVFETTLESRKLYGFGGTSFHILENYIQRTIAANKEAYPKAVFVITDGYGDNVYPQYPDVWHWFLSTSCTHCIPKECNIHSLSNFE